MYNFINNMERDDMNETIENILAAVIGLIVAVVVIYILIISMM